MKRIARYLIDNYYKKFPGMQIPEESMLVQALDLHQDKVIVVHEGENILGVAAFLTLTDESFKYIESVDISTVESLRDLLLEDGPNIHIIMLTTKGIRNIMAGIRAIKKERNPKSISWWDPSLKQLHKYTLN